MRFQPVNPGWDTFARLAGDFKNLQPRVEHLHTLLEIIHAEIEIRQQVNFIDYQHI